MKYRPTFTSKDRRNMRLIAATVFYADTAPETAHPARTPQNATQRPDPALRGVNPALAGVR